MTAIRPRRILIIRTGGLGDFILCLPVIHALRAAWPDADVELLGRQGIAILARPHVTRITSIDDRRFARLFADTPLDSLDPANAYLSSFDLVVSFLGVPESAFGHKLRSLVPLTLFMPAPPSAGERHATIHFLESLAPLGIECAANVPHIDLPKDIRKEGARRLERLTSPSEKQRPIIVHPGSGGRRKNWPPHLFAQTIRLFFRAEQRVVLLQGEADEPAVRDVLAQLEQDQVPVLEDASLHHVAGAISCSRLVVGNDSGISHLAAAIGTPLVCLFGPTDPAVWRPLGTAIRVLSFAEATPQRVYAEGAQLMAD